MARDRARIGWALLGTIGGPVGLQDVWLAVGCGLLVKGGWPGLDTWHPSAVYLGHRHVSQSSFRHVPKPLLIGCKTTRPLSCAWAPPPWQASSRWAPLPSLRTAAQRCQDPSRSAAFLACSTSSCSWRGWILWGSPAQARTRLRWVRSCNSWLRWFCWFALVPRAMLHAACVVVGRTAVYQGRLLQDQSCQGEVLLCVEGLTLRLGFGALTCLGQGTG